MFSAYLQPQLAEEGELPGQGAGREQGQAAGLP